MKMDIKKFREQVSKQKDYKEIFSSFRKREGNCYDYYQKESELAKYQYGSGDDLDEGDERAWKYDWNYIAYEIMVDLYNYLDREIDEDFKKKEKECIGIEDPFLDFCVTFSELHKKIEQLEDDVEFVYAVFCIVKSLWYEENIYKTYAKKLYDVVRLLNMEEYFRMAGVLNNKRVFIAMSFDSIMEKVREQIKKAVDDSGYIPVLIDEAEYNNQIVPEIYKAIEESRFVIADLTKQRNGVYYEAGYAVGAGKELILCCEASERNVIHFDVAQINTILWKNEKDLYKKLRERIQATIK